MVKPADVFDVNKKFNKELIFVAPLREDQRVKAGHWYSQKSTCSAKSGSPSTELRALYSTKAVAPSLIWEYVNPSLYVLKNGMTNTVPPTPPM